MLKRFLLLTLFHFVLNNDVFSQCAMCKSVVEANLESGDTKGAGLNDGILSVSYTHLTLPTTD